MEELKKAASRAKEIIAAHIKTTPTNDLEARLRKMTKEQLVQELLSLQQTNPKTYTIEDIVYDILGDPACAWLTWEMLSGIIQASIPGSQTSKKSLQWYGSKAAERNRTVVPRKRACDLVALIQLS